MRRLRFFVWPAVICAVVAFFYSGLVFSRLIIGDYDAFVYFYPLREYAATVLSHRGVPLWNPYLFMGSPFFANIQTAVAYPPDVIFMFLPTPYAFSVSVVGHVVLAGVGMYGFCRRVLSTAAVPSLLGAIVFALSGFISFQVSHINQLSVSAWLPLLLVVFDEALKRRSLWVAAVAGGVGTLQLLAGHTQEWYFSTATLGLFAVWRIAVPRDGRSSADVIGGGSGIPAVRTWPAGLLALLPRAYPIAALAVAGVIEVGVAAIQWVPTLELSGESIRGGGLAYGEAISFSLPPVTALYTLLPTYPSTLFSEYVGYVGVIPLALAVVAVARWGGRPATMLMAGLTVFGLFMAFGGYNPLAPLMFKLIPGLNLFRVPARWLLVYTFGVAGLTALGMQVLVETRSLAVRRSDQARRVTTRSHLIVSATLLGCSALLIGLLAILARPAPHPALVAVWLVLGCFPVASLVLLARTARARYPVLALLIVASCLELWSAGANAAYRHAIPAEAYMPDRSSTSFIQSSLGSASATERVLSIATNDYEVKETPDYKKEYSWLDQKALTDFIVAVKLNETLAPNLPVEYGIQSPDGYDGGVLPLRKYGELKAIMVPPEGAAPDSLLRNNLAYVPPTRFLDLMGVKYVLAAKVKDAKVENVYYDRGISMDLRADQTATLKRIPDIQATSIGVVSNAMGARTLPDGTSAGNLVVKDDSGKSYELPLRLGSETAESSLDDDHSAAVAHKRPQEVANWPPGNKDADYFVKIRLPNRMRVKEVSVTGLLPDASLRVHAMTLIDDLASQVAPLILSDDFDRQEFFDMKVYTYRDAIPRAFVTYGAAVRDDEIALGDIQRGETSIRETALVAPSATAKSFYRSSPPVFQASDARVVSSQPEKVSIEATAREDGYLVLLDAFYPGWVARVDGKEAPVERADYLFRAVYLTKGSHTVVFSYEPSSFYKGAQLTGISIFLLGLAYLSRTGVIRRGRVL